MDKIVDHLFVFRGQGIVEDFPGNYSDFRAYDSGPAVLQEDKEMIEDLIVAAHNDAKSKLKKKTSEEISKVTGGVDLPPGFKLPF